MRFPQLRRSGIETLVREFSFIVIQGTDVEMSNEPLFLEGVLEDPRTFLQEVKGMKWESISYRE